MIYAMPGMETELQAVINKEGEFRGLSGHYSGSGFSRMNFSFRSFSQQGFDEWVAKAKAAGTRLDREAYLKLDKPSEAEPVRYYGAVEDGLYDAILGLCVTPDQMCVQRDAPHRQRWAAPARIARQIASGSITTIAGFKSGHEPSGATFPASGRPPEEFRPAGRHDAPRSAPEPRWRQPTQNRARPRARQRSARSRQGARPAPADQSAPPNATSTDPDEHPHVPER